MNTLNIIIVYIMITSSALIGLLNRDRLDIMVFSVLCLLICLIRHIELHKDIENGTN